MNRLTNRTYNDLIKCQSCIEESNCYENSCGEIEKSIHKLREYENLESDGLLVRLPMRINTNSVYYIDHNNELHYGYIDSYTITEVGYGFTYINFDNTWDKDFTEYDIGKIIFFTREKAENELNKIINNK